MLEPHRYCCFAGVRSAAQEPDLLCGVVAFFLPVLTAASPPISLSTTASAYYFTRSILLCIRTLEGKDDSIYNSVWKGWVLTGFFFLNAWLLGKATFH